jgi:hypothetical protein
MADLSPCAQAVLDAVNKELDEAPWDVSHLAGSVAAAALRAAALYCKRDNLILLALADELEGSLT